MNVSFRVKVHVMRSIQSKLGSRMGSEEGKEGPVNVARLSKMLLHNLPKRDDLGNPSDTKDVADKDVAQVYWLCAMPPTHSSLVLGTDDGDNVQCRLLASCLSPLDRQ